MSKNSIFCAGILALNLSEFKFERGIYAVNLSSNFSEIYALNLGFKFSEIHAVNLSLNSSKFKSKREA